MDYEITKLHKEDFLDAIDFINMVFSMNDRPTDFVKILPAYYQPTEHHMECHQVIKINGKIRALLGIYPTTLMIGKTAFKVARVGAVSVHPNYREHGLMKELMSYCNALIEKDGYDFCMLSGSRHRYLYYGYEKIGYRFVFHITKSNIKHWPFSYEDIQVKPILENNDTLLSYYQSLYERQKLHFIRKTEEFFSICHHWSNSLYGVFHSEVPVGYFIINSNNNITEIFTENPQITIKALAIFLSNSSINRVTVNCNPMDKELCYEYSKIYETSEIVPVQNVRILNWERLISSLLNYKLEKIILPSGSLIIGINEYGNILITIENGKASCNKTIEKAIVVVDFSTASRIFFGNLSPSYVMLIPDSPMLFDAWFPLPFYISPQDFA